MSVPVLTAERLRTLLRYDPETGFFVWLIMPNGRVLPGTNAGAKDGDGYVGIGIDKRNYKAHRLAWLYMMGCWPVAQIDHINGQRSDNRIVNLRQCSQSQNNANSCRRIDSTSGYKGISWHCRRNAWQAHVTKDGYQKYLGLFYTPESAARAYDRAAREVFGEFAALNFPVDDYAQLDAAVRSAR